MKSSFILILLLFVSQAHAQDYSCVPPEYKTFYTNASGYLRGMRIDSIKIINGDNIYYPFKTARIANDLDLQMADTNGGSWLGAEIIEDTTGITRIPTRSGDTIIIKNNAALNESWTFYQDTGARYYEATVTATDTATFAGISDSVKVIRINVKEGTAVITSDSLNNLEIILSKSHGFFQVPGLYLFPFKNALDLDVDYYVGLSRGNFNELRKEELLFRRIPFTYPANQDIYDFEPGDVFYSGSNAGTNMNGASKNIILSKATTDTTFSYQVKVYSHWSSGPNSGQDSSVNTWNYSNGLLIDSVKMPEEWHNDKICHYRYQDSSFCLSSNVYQTDESHISFQGQLIHFEAGTHTLVYKEKIGNITEIYTNEPEWSIHTYIYAAKKFNHSCDDENNPLVIDERNHSSNNHSAIYPNPADETLHVKLSGDPGAFRVTLSDITGRKILAQGSNRKTSRCL